MILVQMTLAQMTVRFQCATKHYYYTHLSK
jgi:hypothetical protein